MSVKLPVHAVATALFSVDAERVFDAWLDTGMIGQFIFGPGHIGEYVEIDRPRRLVFTWGAGDPSASSRVVIEIASIVDGCELTLTHEMPAGQKEFIEQSKIAWGKMLDKLTEIL